MVLSLARYVSTAAQLVPPAPAMSIAPTPAFSRAIASSALIPAPVSLAITGTLSVLHISSMALICPLALTSPSGCIASCNGFKCTANAFAFIILIDCSASSICWHPMLPIRNPDGASSLTIVYVGASSGFLTAAR